MEELISEHLATWTEAEMVPTAGGRGRKSSGERNRYGIKKLRELILELAVRGKLVAQDPADEPASVLLERIAAEKASLLKAGKIKKQKGLPEITEEEKPFALPAGWAWARLGDIGIIIGGGTPKSSHLEFFSDNDIPWLTPADMRFIQGKYVSRGKRDISKLGLEKSSAQLIYPQVPFFSQVALP